jgi:hypothetical protein
MQFGGSARNAEVLRFAQMTDLLDFQITNCQLKMKREAPFLASR